ncbi:hypothetical protein DXG01_002092 [Tephrocybe rancida]|nr:hypothetical protein DXG01_002092 [Tephrocybe rancida]
MFRACWTQSSRVVASSSSQSSSLHTSAVLHAQASRQHVARRIKKLNIERKKDRWRKAQATRPSVILGTRPGDEVKWKNCLLAKVLINVEELVADTALIPTQQGIGTVYLPKQTSFGVGEAEKKLLFGTLPVLSSTRGKDFAQPANATQPAAEAVDKSTFVGTDWLVEGENMWKANIEQEQKKANAFATLIDLRNANADGIAYENRKRIVQAFSTPGKPLDTGRSEVQGSSPYHCASISQADLHNSAALLTYKIRNLWTHLQDFKRDVGNQRGLRMLVHQRAKILKYLKKVDQVRYETVLEQLGLEPESVEGELVV